MLIAVAALAGVIVGFILAICLLTMGRRKALNGIVNLVKELDK